MSITKEQPAIKSYFFGKGYSDLKSTITDCWDMNSEASKKYFEEASIYWEKDDWTKVIAVIKSFAGISVIIFGSIWFLALSLIHVAILGIVFGIIYIFFTLLLIIENIYMYTKKIFVSCPNCHEKFPIPYYLCPKCKKEHTNLIPSSYGILNHICLCGEKLPSTFFNGRHELEARCPNSKCSRSIETRESTPVCLPIIGGPSAGKTCFLLTLTNCIIDELALKNNWTINFLNQQNEDIYNNLLENYNKGIVPNKTVDQTPIAFNFFVRSKKWSPDKIMYLYDSAGEAFESMDNLKGQLYYQYVHGFIFLIDPFSIPKLAEEYEEQLKLNYNDIRPSKYMIDDILASIILHLEKNHNIKRNERITRPCALVINKIDAFDLEDKFGENAVNNLILKNPTLSYQDAMHKTCLDFFKEMELNNFLKTIEQKFANYRFFTVSTLGNSKKFIPVRTKEPIKWILSKSDKDFKFSD